VIDRVENTTFYATVRLSREGRTISIDARPSDSIALAVRTAAPLYVDEDVINSNSYPFFVNDSGHPQESTMEEFRDFLDSISPEDFQVTE
jgi:bifunctional DNase/RNase